MAKGQLAALSSEGGGGVALCCGAGQQTCGYFLISPVCPAPTLLLPLSPPFRPPFLPSPSPLSLPAFSGPPLFFAPTSQVPTGQQRHPDLALSWPCPWLGLLPGPLYIIEPETVSCEQQRLSRDL